MTPRIDLQPMMNTDAIIRKFIVFGDDPMTRSTTDDEHSRWIQL